MYLITALPCSFSWIWYQNHDNSRTPVEQKRPEHHWITHKFLFQKIKDFSGKKVLIFQNYQYFNIHFFITAGSILNSRLIYPPFNELFHLGNFLARNSNFQNCAIGFVKKILFFPNLIFFIFPNFAERWNTLFQGTEKGCQRSWRFRRRLLQTAWEPGRLHSSYMGIRRLPQTLPWLWDQQHPRKVVLRSWWVWN